MWLGRLEIVPAIILAIGVFKELKMILQINKCTLPTGNLKKSNIWGIAPDHAPFLTVQANTLLVFQRTEKKIPVKV